VGAWPATLDLVRRRRTRFLPLLLIATVPVQIPLVATLGRLTHSPLLVTAVAAVMTVAFLLAWRSPFSDAPRGPLTRGLVLRPFFVYWATCVVAWVALPVGAVAAHALGPPALFAALGVSLVGGLAGNFRQPRLVRREVTISGLPSALDGYTIAQLSDVHCGPYTPPEEVARWVERVNALDADLVAVTGDLITSGDRYTEAVATVLGALRGRDGVFACMGNHDYFADGERFARRLAASGLRVLRNEGTVIRRGEAALFVGGVDDTWTGRADVERALRRRPDGVTSLLLAHDPNLFPQAAAEGVSLTLSGHTHGGQIAVPVPGLARRWTLARMITRYPAGIYRTGASTLYVSRGAGFTGPPVRIGAPAEITLIVLRAA
jgi:predicted MPP superfamily phosphohydrolase